jgi:uncharacterized protein (TIGR02246 family)
MSRTIRTCWTALVVLSLSAAARPLLAADRDEVAEVEAALQRYNAFVLAMDNAAIAELYAEDGELAGPNGPVRGRKAIREFLETFKDFHVKANKTTPEKTSVNGETATQSARYWQRVELPSHETVEVSGRLDAQWAKHGGRWLIQHMAATPDPPAKR